MISVTNLRSGAYFADGKDIFQVLSYKHQKLGRGTANIKLKVKNLKTGANTEKSFISGARVEEAILERREAQYLYKSQKFVFMDPKTFEQFELAEDKIGEVAHFLKEGSEYKILFYKPQLSSGEGVPASRDEPLAVELPIKMEFTVAETGPSIRGDSATNIFKDAILETGAKIKVPLFVKVGDRVVVDTRTGEYQARLTKGE